MKMSRDELLMALRAVLPGVSSGEALLPGADSFVFSPGLVQSYNDHLSVTYPLDTGMEVHAAVRATEMVRVLERMSGLEVEMSLGESSLEVTDGRTSLSMRRIDAATHRLLEALALDDLEWVDLPGGFTEAMALCLPSVSRNQTHGALTGIHVHGIDVMSSDNFRATWATLEGAMPEFTLPANGVADLLRIGELERYATTEAWANFMSTEGVVFSSRLIASEFPYEGLKRLFPDAAVAAGEAYELPEGLVAAVGRVAPLAYQRDGGDSFISLWEESGSLVVKGERDCGSAIEVLELVEGGWPDGTVINIQPKYLLDIMGRTREFSMVDKLVHFRGGNFRHIIASIIRE